MTTWRVAAAAGATPASQAIRPAHRARWMARRMAWLRRRLAESVWLHARSLLISSTREQVPHTDAPSGAARAEQAGMTGEASVRKARVLVVEDHAFVRTLMADH